jgi:hypothetical protein
VKESFLQSSSHFPLRSYRADFLANKRTAFLLALPNQFNRLTMSAVVAGADTCPDYAPVL